MMSLPADAESAKLRALIHGITTAPSINTTPDAPEAQTTNAWKWGVICKTGGLDDGDVFVSFPYEAAWASDMSGNVQMLGYMADLRLQALDFMAKNDMWPDKAAIARYQQINTIWLVRARTWLEQFWKYKNDETAHDRGKLH